MLESKVQSIYKGGASHAENKPLFHQKRAKPINREGNTQQKDRFFNKPKMQRHHAQAPFPQTHHETSPHNIVQTPTICPTPRAVGSRGLNWSTEVFQRTPRLHQTHLLWEPSSPKPSCHQPSCKGEWLPIFGRGFGLRCFQPLSSAAWLPGVCPVGQPVN